MWRSLLIVATPYDLDWLRNKGGTPDEDFVWRNPPSKIRMEPQQAVAGVGTSKSCFFSGKAIHTIRSSSLTQVLQLCLTTSCPRHPHHQLSLCSYVSMIPHFVHQNFRCLWFISAYFFQIDFFHSGRMAKFLPGQSERWGLIPCQISGHGDVPVWNHYSFIQHGVT